MKTFASLVAVTLLGVCSVAEAQINLPDPSSPGMTPDNAVRIVGSELMVDRFISRWLHTHYPGWSAEPHQFTEIGFARYAVVYISAPNNPSRRIYFRLARSQNEDDDAVMPDRRY